ncbi:uncharacterized protein N7515_008433 [Penicillium bovifimosum]|uniref:Stress-associated endoplasmic reticulum protein n=1 Tax=Penicillium bovifimosum TaxID=126998 RepID=A0A9W9GMZ6_9EURO|nr:uncharacterized protein N7515_008433 [Penicillium bovifimosum]KAJ5124608.1 hypothetical protein N7515_008433 [Penicillium bovifimosum]
MASTNPTATSSKRPIREDRGREKRKGAYHGQTEEDHEVAPFNELVLLAFVVCGGLLLELLRIVPELWSTVSSWVTRLMG